MLKKILWLPALVLFFASIPVLAHAANAEGESVKSFDSEITVHADANITVKETIVYNFGPAERRGIYRYIPVKFKTNAGNLKTRISGISVTDENGAPYEFSARLSGSDETIKIGNPDIFVSGVKTYIISYTIKQAVNYFNDHDELYWNVTGNGWEVPILEANAVIMLPENAEQQGISMACYAGAAGETVSCKSAGFSGKNIVFSQLGLAAGQGLTIVAGFPTGLVNKPTMLQKVWAAVRDNWVLGLPVFVLLMMIYVWHTRGRDPEGAGTIVAQYDPPDNLTPAEVGTILDESADNADISAEIIYLAAKGYLKITRIEKKALLFDSADYRLDLLKDGADITEPFDRKLLEGLFKKPDKSFTFSDLQNALTGSLPAGKQKKNNSTSLSDLRSNFYNDLRSIKNEIYGSAVTKGYFPKDPRTVRNRWIIGGVAAAAAGIFAAILTQQLYYGLGLGLSGLLLVIFSFFMPAKTRKGAEARNHILGLKLYLSVAEKARLEFHNAPEKTPDRFEKLLPYAMVLKVEKEWAKQFEGIYNQPPGWYNDPTGRAFSAGLFVGSLHNFQTSAGGAMSPQSRSSGAAGGHSGFGGGGFSGGGFGGGGGGSW